MLQGEASQYVRDAFRALNLRALDPSDPAQRARYVPLYEREALRDQDPVAALHQIVRYSEHGSASLFSGYKGTGKSTELLRLQRRLQEQEEAIVVYCNMDDFINLDTPPDVPDLLLATAGAFSDAVEADETLRGCAPGYWDRVVDFLKAAEIDVSGMEVKGEAGGVGLGVKLGLKGSPTFQRRLQQHLASQVSALARQLRSWYAQVVQALQARHGQVPVVAIFDSIDHIRGTATSARQVAEHLVATFNRSDHLRIPGVHVIYTVPPWMKIRAPEVLAVYDHAHVLPCLKLRDEKDEPDRGGVDAAVEVVGKRFDWERLLPRDELERVVRETGGYFRDLFRVLQGLLLACDRRGALPATCEQVTRALDEVRNSYLPLTIEDATWLARIDHTGDVQLAGLDDLGELARLFDGHLVLTYRNGREWYRAHPLIRGEAARLAGEAPDEGARPAAEGAGER